MSDTAVYSQNHAERTAYLEKLIKAIEKNKRVGSFLFRVGSGSFLMALAVIVEVILDVGVTIVNFTMASFILLPFVALIALGLYLSRYQVGRLEQLEKEYYELYALRRFSEKNLNT